MWPKNFLLNLLNFKDDLLGIGGEEEETFDCLPIHQGVSVPLVARISEGIDESAEKRASFTVNFGWSLNERYFI